MNVCLLPTAPQLCSALSVRALLPSLRPGDLVLGNEWTLGAHTCFCAYFKFKAGLSLAAGPTYWKWQQGSLWETAAWKHKQEALA